MTILIISTLAQFRRLTEETPDGASDVFAWAQGTDAAGGFAVRSACDAIVYLADAGAKVTLESVARWRSEGFGGLIFILGDADSNARLRAMENGTDDCLAGSCQLRELLLRVRGRMSNGRSPST